MSLSEALPATAIDTVSELTCRSATGDLPKVPTWRLERDSSPRRAGPKASTLLMRHRLPELRHHRHTIASLLTQKKLRCNLIFDQHTHHRYSLGLLQSQHKKFIFI